MKSGTPNPHGREGKPISLSDYSFEDAVRKILQAPPEPKRKPKKKPRKQTSNKRWRLKESSE